MLNERVDVDILYLPALNTGAQRMHPDKHFGLIKCERPKTNIVFLYSLAVAKMFLNDPASHQIKILINEQELNEDIVNSMQAFKKINPKTKILLAYHIDSGMASLEGIQSGKINTMGVTHDSNFFSVLGGMPMEDTKLANEKLYAAQVEHMVHEKRQGEFAGIRRLLNLEFYNTSEVIPKLFPLLTEFFMTDSTKKLYVFLAPPGYGKSTMIKNLERYGIKPLQKITTRKQRPDEKNNTASISTTYFNQLEQNGDILAGHFFLPNRQYYGVMKEDIESVNDGLFDAYALDFCDFDATNSLRTLYPKNVKLVGIFPSLDFAGYGLELRLSNFLNPDKEFKTFEEQLRQIELKRGGVADTIKRLDQSIEEAKIYMHFLPDCDHVLTGSTIEENVEQMLQIIIEDKR